MCNEHIQTKIIIYHAKLYVNRLMKISFFINNMYKNTVQKQILHRIEKVNIENAFPIKPLFILFRIKQRSSAVFFLFLRRNGKKNNEQNYHCPAACKNHLLLCEHRLAVKSGKGNGIYQLSEDRHRRFFDRTAY